ncbi:MAG: hypothetical protein ACRD19_17570 [Terriglobia bacterium]
MITIKRIKLLPDTGNAVRAIADVEIQGFALAGEKKITGNVGINGLRVIEGKNGKGAWISFPAKQGQSTWFDIATVTGELLRALCDAVLARYAEERKRA